MYGSNAYRIIYILTALKEKNYILNASYTYKRYKIELVGHGYCGVYNFV
jgi:hypothetical protein